MLAGSHGLLMAIIIFRLCKLLKFSLFHKLLYRNINSHYKPKVRHILINIFFSLIIQQEPTIRDSRHVIAWHRWVTQSLLLRVCRTPHTTLGLFTKPNARYSKERVSFLSSMLCRQLPIYVYLVILLRILKENTENGLLFTCSFYAISCTISALKW